MALPSPVFVGDHVEWYGDFAIDRTFQPGVDGQYAWVAYKRVPTGITLKDGAEDEPVVQAALGAYVDAVPPEFVNQMGEHPVSHEPTTFAHVWVPIAEGSHDAMLARIEQELA